MNLINKLMRFRHMVHRWFGAKTGCDTIGCCTRWLTENERKAFGIHNRRQVSIYLNRENVRKLKNYAKGVKQ